MATKKKLLQAAAGAAGGEALNVEDVFSTYLYEGDGSAQTITNGIDLDGEGGMVWLKRRSASESHYLYDTERGIRKAIRSDSTAAQSTLSLGLDIFNSDGFRLNVSHTDSGVDFTTWTFRKAPKFFDVVTWTGTGSTQSISHNLDSQIGFMAVKATSYVDNWYAFHRQMANPYSYTQPYLRLNDTFGVTGLGDFGTSVNLSNTSSFQVSGNINLSGVTYVAYLFAHNDGDGEFGPDGDADIIKCGSYSGDSTTDGSHEIDLGFEPQWVLIKQSNGSDLWFILDTMRGMTDSSGSGLYPHSSAGEDTNASVFKIQPTPTGFRFFENSGFFNLSGEEYIYIAIRRGPMAVPTDATDVFEQAFATSPGNPNFVSGFPVDAALRVFTDGSSVYPQMSSRLTQGKYLKTSSTAAEVSFSSWAFDYQDGVIDGTSASSLLLTYMWKRAPSFFDVVAYTGNGTAGRTVSHNLGVAPEMIWVKNRDDSDNWEVYHSALTATSSLRLNTTNDEIVASTRWNNTEPTDTVFTVGTWNTTNGSGDGMIAYLFASLDGVSKVGSYTGDGTSDGSKVIDCGFSAGARFVLIKRTDNTGNWNLFDTERGITVGFDPQLRLNTTDAEDTTIDVLAPSSSGFALTNASSNYNALNSTYIFYAIA